MMMRGRRGAIRVCAKANRVLTISSRQPPMLRAYFRFWSKADMAEPAAGWDPVANDPNRRHHGSGNLQFARATRSSAANFRLEFGVRLAGVHETQCSGKPLFC